MRDSFRMSSKGRLSRKRSRKIANASVEQSGRRMATLGPAQLTKSAKRGKKVSPTPFAPFGLAAFAAFAVRVASVPVLV